MAIKRVAAWREAGFLSCATSVTCLSFENYAGISMSADCLCMVCIFLQIMYMDPRADSMAPNAGRTQVTTELTEEKDTKRKAALAVLTLLERLAKTRRSVRFRPVPDLLPHILQ